MRCTRRALIPTGSSAHRSAPSMRADRRKQPQSIRQAQGILAARAKEGGLVSELVGGLPPRTTPPIGRPCLGGISGFFEPQSALASGARACPARARQCGLSTRQRRCEQTLHRSGRLFVLLAHLQAAAHRRGRPCGAPARCAISTAANARSTARHIMASGALPPAFPAVRIDGELYWDGGILSNTPSEAVFEDNPRRVIPSSSRCTCGIPKAPSADHDPGGAQPPQGRAVFQPHLEPDPAATAGCIGCVTSSI